MRLRQIARDSILHGLIEKAPPQIDLHREAPELRQMGASFVTLKRRARLRGCIGSIEARQALALDVNQNAYAAAFCDARFDPVQPDELDEITISISVLHPPEPMHVRDEKDLLRLLRPHRDGLILQLDRRRATFLPAVWEDLPDAGAFVRHLKLKAGLPADGWDPAIRCWRYETESF